MHYKEIKGEFFIWRWKIDSVNPELLQVKYDRLKRTNHSTVYLFSWEGIFSRLGLPDKDTHKFSNGYYSSEYNNCLYLAIDMDIVEIVWDSINGDFFDFVNVEERLLKVVTTMKEKFEMSDDDFKKFLKDFSFTPEFFK